MERARTAVALVLAIALLPKPASAGPSWGTVAPGVAFASWQATVPGARAPLSVDVVRADRARVRVDVVDVYGTLAGRAASASPRYGLADIAARVHPLALVNGGFTESYSVPLPSGLLVVQGRTVGRANTRSKVQSGLLCLSGGTITIRRFTAGASGCRSALQSGPLLVESNGRVAVANDRSKPAYERSAVGLDRSGRWVMCTTSPTSLYDLACWMAASEARGGLGCTVAMNLSGAAEAGLWVYTPSGSIRRNSTETLVGSAIAVFKR